MELAELASTVALTIYVSVGSPPAAPPQAAQRAAREAIEIWRRAGVTIQTVQRDELRTNPPDIYVYFTARFSPGRVTPGARTEPIAWIGFVDGRPSNRVFVSSAAGRQLVEADERLGPEFNVLPPGGQAQMLGRVLGRALAHEIGHFLFASMEHSSSGLMRATHSIVALATDPSTSFDIDPGSFGSRVAGVEDDCSLMTLSRGWSEVPIGRDR